MDGQDLSSELSSSQREVARLEERCEALAAAQAPINELTEKLMDQLRDRDQAAMIHSQVEAAAQVLDRRLT